MVTVSFRIDEETYKQLKRKADEEGVTVSDLLRAMLKECLNIEIKSELEERLEDLEKRIQEIEKLVKRQAGLGFYIKK